MIRIKSILNRTGYQHDGTRICITRFVKPFYDYDELIVNLAPSIQLLNQYQGQRISWNEFSNRYRDEMELRMVEIARLRRRSDLGETITLLCWEWSSQHCHRTICKDLIAECQFWVKKD